MHVRRVYTAPPTPAPDDRNTCRRHTNLPRARHITVLMCTRPSTRFGTRATTYTGNSYYYSSLDVGDDKSLGTKSNLRHGRKRENGFCYYIFCAHDAISKLTPCTNGKKITEYYWYRELNAAASRRPRRRGFFPPIIALPVPVSPGATLNTREHPFRSGRCTARCWTAWRAHRTPTAGVSARDVMSPSTLPPPPPPTTTTTTTTTPAKGNGRDHRRRRPIAPAATCSGFRHRGRLARSQPMHICMVNTV